MLHIVRSQIVIVPFALYVCAMEKMLSRNADIVSVTAIVIMIIISYMARIYKVLCSSYFKVYKRATQYQY